MHKAWVLCLLIGLAACSGQDSTWSETNLEQLRQTFEASPTSKFWESPPVKVSMEKALGGKTTAFMSTMEVTTPVRTNGSVVYVMGWKSQSPGDSGLLVLDLASQKAFAWWSEQGKVAQSSKKPGFILPYQAQAFIDSWELRKNSPPMSELSDVGVKSHASQEDKSTRQ